MVTSTTELSCNVCYKCNQKVPEKVLTRYLIVAASTRIKHRINQTVVSSLANTSVSRLVMLLNQHAKSLQTRVFFIICTFASLMCIKKPRYNKAEAMICSAQNRSEWESLFPTFGREVFSAGIKEKTYIIRPRLLQLLKQRSQMKLRACV